MDDTVELGGNIVLSGFKDIDGGSMVIIKKIVGQYAKNLSENADNFQKLSVALDSDEGYSIRCEAAANGKNNSAEASNVNLFMALDKSLKKLNL